MLVQAQHRRAAEHEAFFERRTYRAQHVRVIALRSARIVTDFQLIGDAVPFMTQCHRTQATLLLEGSGYFLADRKRHVPLRAGDLVLSDQQLLEPEGYAGDRMLALIVEWDGDTLAPAWRGAARFGRLAAADVARARRALAREDAESTVREVLAVLRSTGIAFEQDVGALDPPSGLDARAQEVTRPLDASLSNLHTYPSLEDLAEALGVTRRHAHRLLTDYTRQCVPYAVGFRDLLHDAQLEAAMQFLSLPNEPKLAHIARLSGYRSAVALCHAFSRRGLRSPREIAHHLRERWR